jgi:hypothetical protein
VSPKYAVVLAGLRYRLPAAGVIALLADTLDAEVWRTDDHDKEEGKKSTTAYGDDNILIATDGRNPQLRVRWNR